MSLRPYQLEAVARFDAFLRSGGRRGVLVLPTGCGKTRTGLAIVAARGGRTLYIAHRDELLRQPAEQIKELLPNAEVGIVKGGEDGCDAKDVVFASIQTLARGNRLARCGEFDLVVVDECHHAVAESYRKVLEALGCFDGTTPVLGLTATPERKGIAQVFEAIFYQYAVVDAVKAGFLCKLAQPIRVKVPKLDLNHVEERQGDFVPGALGRAMVAAQASTIAADAVARFARGRRTLAFTVTVEQARLTATELCARGIRAAVISAATPAEERKATLAAFAAGQLDALCNAAILTEGYDCPRVDCVVVARPTKSAILYRQMVGRGLRLHADKSDCLLVDLYGSYDRHDLMSAGKLLGGAFEVKKARYVVRLVEKARPVVATLNAVLESVMSLVRRIAG